jgi:hypothetical protein
LYPTGCARSNAAAAHITSYSPNARPTSFRPTGVPHALYHFHAASQRLESLGGRIEHAHDRGLRPRIAERRAVGDALVPRTGSRLAGRTGKVHQQPFESAACEQATMTLSRVHKRR